MKSNNFIIARNSNILDIKILGSFLNTNQDISSKIKKANAAFYSYIQIWRRNNNNINLDLKVKLYNILVKSLILYNSTCLPLLSSSKNAKLLNILHRKHLRYILNIHNPRDISNKQLYTDTKSVPLDIQICKLRWKYIGRLFRLDPSTPAIKLMENYFINNDRKKYIGFEITSLPYVMNKDLILISKQLKNIDDLHSLIGLAQNKVLWDKDIAVNIYKKKLEIWNAQTNLNYDSNDDLSSLDNQNNLTYTEYTFVDYIPLNCIIKVLGWIYIKGFKWIKYILCILVILFLLYNFMLLQF